MIRLTYLLAPLCLAACSALSAQADRIDLAGSWRFALDAADANSRLAPGQWKLADTIRLPGMVTAQGFGAKPTFETQWTGDGWRYPNLFREWQAADNFKMPFFLQPPLHYEGPAWYQRDVDIPSGWAGRDVVLFAERVHWQSTAWLDGRQVGRSDSLGTPHEFDLGALTPGRHTLTLRIDNRLGEVNVGPMSHSVTDHTQGNWNGVVGALELRARPAAHLTDVRVDPSFAGRSVKIIVTGGNGRATAAVRYVGPSKDRFITEPVSAELTGGRAELTVPVAEPRPWNEFTPHRYVAEVSLDSPAGRDTRTVGFGFRDVGRRDGRLALNGTPIFLRGTLECCIFPLTGHPPTDLDSWRRIVRICRAHGLNHIRFHSWCPPEAAFVAADELGFYYQLEASSWANGGAEIGSGRPLDAWMDAETERMVRAYGNHPSFLMMAYGNEPAGRNHAKWLADWVARWKAKDARHFWTTGSGWPLMAGSDYHSSPSPRIQGWGQGLRSIINAEPPRTDFDFGDYVKAHADAPVVSHEIGQWCVYPNFAEIGKYTGYVRARNFEIFRETARRNGLLPQAHDFVIASGKLQTLCYKHDIEAALRTPGFGGFQLLDLHDFPGQGTALVGVLDPFWDAKGYVTAAEYAQFSGPIVPLARLPRMVWSTGETLSAELLLSHFGPSALPGLTPTWKLTQGASVVAQGRLPARDLAAGALHTLGSLSVPLAAVTAPAQLRLTVGALGQSFGNGWDLFVYPESAPAEPAGAVVATDLESAQAALARGEKVLWLAHGSVADDRARPLVAGFSSMFWNTAWTNWQPPHTLGILCDPKHPALAGFPTESHSNWQWWEVQKGARPFILTPHQGLRPVVQVIDDWVTNRRLAYVFEAQVGPGRLLACSADLTSDLARRPAARQLRASLLAYLAGSRLAPAAPLAPTELAALVTPVSAMSRLGARATASSAEPTYPAVNAIDGDPQTLWHTEYTARTPEPPHELTLGFAAPTVAAGVLITQRQDGNANGQANAIELLDADGRLLAKANVPPDAVDFRVNLPAGTRLAALRLRIVSSHKGPWASLAEVSVAPGD